ncbi:unnamed protein product [Closterium sp. Naga37s-1]|nr:unnamed protein product [Closterium sp. Naga37s-1]
MPAHQIVRYSFFAVKEAFGFTPVPLLWLRYNAPHAHPMRLHARTPCSSHSLPLAPSAPRTPCPSHPGPFHVPHPPLDHLRIPCLLPLPSPALPTPFLPSPDLTCLHHWLLALVLHPSPTHLHPTHAAVNPVLLRHFPSPSAISIPPPQLPFPLRHFPSRSAVSLLPPPFPSTYAISLPPTPFPFPFRHFPSPSAISLPPPPFPFPLRHLPSPSAVSLPPPQLPFPLRHFPSPSTVSLPPPPFPFHLRHFPSPSAISLPPPPSPFPLPRFPSPSAISLPPPPSPSTLCHLPSPPAISLPPPPFRFPFFPSCISLRVQHVLCALSTPRASPSMPLTPFSLPCLLPAPLPPCAASIRYSMFYVLYPSGITSEVGLAFFALAYLKVRPSLSFSLALLHVSSCCMCLLLSVYALFLTVFSHTCPVFLHHSLSLCLYL